MESPFHAAAQLLLEARGFVVDGSDCVWTTVDTASALRAKIDNCLELLEKKEAKGIREGAFLFAPTGDLQEHALSNGWVDDYMKLAARFDLLGRSFQMLSAL